MSTKLGNLQVDDTLSLSGLSGGGGGRGKRGGFCPWRLTLFNICANALKLQDIFRNLSGKKADKVG